MHPFLQQLLAGQAVEWKPLGEVCDFRNGFAFKSNLFKDIGLPIIRISNINGKEIDLNDLKYFDIVDYNINLSPYEIQKGDILIAMSGATTGKIGLFNKDSLAYLNQRVGKFIPNTKFLNNKFLYHILLSKTDFLYTMAGGGAQPNLSSNKLMEQLVIPIPPLSVQTKIAQILDKFTAITAELNMRNQQYQYYRDKLLSVDELAKVGFEWKTLGEVVNLKRGKRLVRSELEEIGEYAVYQNSLQPLGYYHQANCPSNSTFIITAGAAGEIGYSCTDFWAADDCYYLECPKDKLNDRFVYHALMNQKPKITGQIRKASVPRLGRNSIENILIPIPSLSEQAQIVAILDKFDTLTQSISEDLPREIELRQKQYEYYREQLLGFSES